MKPKYKTILEQINELEKTIGTDFEIIIGIDKQGRKKIRRVII